MIGKVNVHIRRERRDGGDVVYLTLENEARLNALDTELMERFIAAFEPLTHDDNLRCLVLTGAGDRAFVSGADVDELAGFAFPSEARSFIGKVHACCEAVRSLPAPVIARINGHAFGAGLELAISCDLRVAAAGAQFGMPEVKLGIPSVVEAALLPGIIGWGRAREMILLGEPVDAEAALAMGLVNVVAPLDGLDAAVEKQIASVFTTWPQAIRLQKGLIRRWEDLSIREGILAGADVLGQAYLSDEPSVAIDAWRRARGKGKGLEGSQSIRRQPAATSPLEAPSAETLSSREPAASAKPGGKKSAKTSAAGAAGRTGRKPR